jgi:hypothetical protein
VLRETKRFNVVDCGRRWGKTTLGINLLVPPAIEGRPVGWFAPSYKYLEGPWHDFTTILRPLIARSNKTERRIELVTGGVVEFWSLEDEDAGRSRKYARVAIDEAAKVKGLGTAWNEAIRPTLADFQGDAFFLSTPKGRDYFWELYSKGLDRLQPDWACWQMPTSTNPYIASAEIEALRDGLPERVFAQEVLAEFLEDGGGVFRRVLEAIDSGRRSPDAATAGRIYSMGSDLARIQDFSVNSVLGPDGRQVWHERYNQTSWTRQTEIIAATSVRFLQAPVNLDTTGLGDPIYEALRAKVMGPIRPYQFTNSSKEALIDNLAIQIEQGRLRLMDIPEQTSELLAFEYEILPSRKVRMQAPEGMHDDCVIALALSAWGLKGTKKVGFL